jgi:hypothetical protein
MTQENARHDDGVASPPLMADRLYTTEELAAILNLDSSTLRRWRTAEPPRGPAFIKLNDRNTRYKGGDLIAWLEALRIDPASAA